MPSAFKTRFGRAHADCCTALHWRRGRSEHNRQLEVAARHHLTLVRAGVPSEESFPDRRELMLKSRDIRLLQL